MQIWIQYFTTYVGSLKYKQRHIESKMAHQFLYLLQILDQMSCWAFKDDPSISSQYVGWALVALKKEYLWKLIKLKNRFHINTKVRSRFSIFKNTWIFLIIEYISRVYMIFFYKYFSMTKHLCKLAHWFGTFYKTW